MAFHLCARSLPLQGEMEEVTKPADGCALVSMSRRNEGNKGNNCRFAPIVQLCRWSKATIIRSIRLNISVL